MRKKKPKYVDVVMRSPATIEPEYLDIQVTLSSEFMHELRMRFAERPSSAILAVGEYSFDGTNPGMLEVEMHTRFPSRGGPEEKLIPARSPRVFHITDRFLRTAIIKVLLQLRSDAHYRGTDDQKRAARRSLARFVSACISQDVSTLTETDLTLLFDLIEESPERVDSTARCYDPDSNFSHSYSAICTN